MTTGFPIDFITPSPASLRCSPSDLTPTTLLVPISSHSSLSCALPPAHRGPRAPFSCTAAPDSSPDLFRAFPEAIPVGGTPVLAPPSCRLLLWGQPAGGRGVFLCGEWHCALPVGCPHPVSPANPSTLATEALLGLQLGRSCLQWTNSKTTSTLLSVPDSPGSGWGWASAWFLPGETIGSCSL